MKNIEY